MPLYIFGGNAIAEGGYGGVKIVHGSHKRDRFIANTIGYLAWIVTDERKCMRVDKTLHLQSATMTMADGTQHLWAFEYHLQIGWFEGNCGNGDE